LRLLLLGRVAIIWL